MSAKQSTLSSQSNRSRILNKLVVHLCGYAILLSSLIPYTEGQAAEWSIPVAGNTFRQDPTLGRDASWRTGLIRWAEAPTVYSTFFHVDRPSTLQLALNARVQEGRSELRVKALDETFSVSLSDQDFNQIHIGEVQVNEPGYVRVDILGTERTGPSYAEVKDLLVFANTEDLKLDYVRSNQGNMFYWGRRGPSVHLRYNVPPEKDLQWAYSEITVPEGEDPLGSFFMANGFREGYFGFQVNSPTERRILFSVWSPFKTDNPNEIPPDQRIATLSKGENVHIGKFGNEGSGGQSYLIFPWQAGKCYRFLTEIKPDSEGYTLYTAWFSEKGTTQWRLIASFRRPKTQTFLRGFHSFLESFSPSYGHVGRRAFYGHTWVADTRRQWHECTEARFSVDATGQGRHRLDFSGGSHEENFYLRNCGFFSGQAKPGTTFTRKRSLSGAPQIDFDRLPRD